MNSLLSLRKRRAEIVLDCLMLVYVIIVLLTFTLGLCARRLLPQLSPTSASPGTTRHCSFLYAHLQLQRYCFLAVMIPIADVAASSQITHSTPFCSLITYDV